MSYKTGGQGKGDNPRPVNKIKFDDNWIRAFGIKCNGCNGEGGISVSDTEMRTCAICKGIGKVGR